MKLRFKRWLEQLQSSYWVIPSIMAVAGLLLVPAQQLLHQLLPEQLLQLAFFVHLQNLDVATVRSVLATVAATAIGTASVVFSVSIVVLSLTASQFGPRLLKNFLSQGIAQLTLGTFIATFMFSLFALTLVDSEVSGINLNYLLVTLTLAFGAGSFFVLIFYIHHIATFIQAPRVIDDVSRTLMARLKALPEAGSSLTDTARSRPDADDEQSYSHSRNLFTPRSGYLQAIDFQVLLQHADSHDLLLKLDVYPGQFVLINQAIACIQHAQDLDQEQVHALLTAFTIGKEKTATQDINFALDQMVEIAVRALSPGINDPFTAINCIDQLAAGLSLLVTRELPPASIYDAQGRLRISKPRTRYIDILNSAFRQIREHAQRDRAVTRHLLFSLLKLHELPLTDDYREAVILHIKEMHDHISLLPQARQARLREILKTPAQQTK
ncbi:MAG: DUF2254 domain-containing protein [Gammaproteobacteria bacterium]|jgi:uncharacterized membrane protein|nr:DUF2254 domain-containing protein [Gammaproteobacteria bacterium]